MRIQKQTKPSEININLKYVCAGCGSHHWVSLDDIQNPNHKIICYYCDISIEIEPIHKISVIYKIDQLKKEKQKQKFDSLDIIDRCAITLVSYGFSKEEAKNLSFRAYDKYKTDDIGFLIKNIIFDFGSNSNESKTSKV